MKFLAPILDLFFPPVCLGCDKALPNAKATLCVACRHDLPVTNFHFDDSEYVKKVFYGRLELQNATSLLRFHKKGIVQKLIHNLKYRGQEEIGTMLGEWLGSELNSIGSYSDIDLVIPVPLHRKKRRQRGYNQVAKFGLQIASALDATYDDQVLVKLSNTKSQVFKKRSARWQKNEGTFTVQNEDRLKGKHVLLVDDIITTGATIEACANELLKTHKITLSVATMAIA